MNSVLKAGNDRTGRLLADKLILSEKASLISQLKSSLIIKHVVYCFSLYSIFLCYILIYISIFNKANIYKPFPASQYKIHRVKFNGRGSIYIRKFSSFNLHYATSFDYIFSIVIHFLHVFFLVTVALGLKNVGKQIYRREWVFQCNFIKFLLEFQCSFLEYVIAQYTGDSGQNNRREFQCNVITQYLYSSSPFFHEIFSFSLGGLYVPSETASIHSISSDDADISCAESDMKENLSFMHCQIFYKQLEAITSHVYQMPINNNQNITINGKHFSIEKERPDGSCFFYALMRFIKKSGSRKLQELYPTQLSIRFGMIEWLKSLVQNSAVCDSEISNIFPTEPLTNNNVNSSSGIIRGPISWENYYERMISTESFADNISIAACCNLLNIDIHIYERIKKSKSKSYSWSKFTYSPNSIHAMASIFLLKTGNHVDSLILQNDITENQQVCLIQDPKNTSSTRSGNSFKTCIHAAKNVLNYQANNSGGYSPLTNKTLSLKYIHIPRDHHCFFHCIILSTVLTLRCFPAAAKFHNFTNFADARSFFAARIRERVYNDAFRKRLITDGGVADILHFSSTEMFNDCLLLSICASDPVLECKLVEFVSETPQLNLDNLAEFFSENLGGDVNVLRSELPQSLKIDLSFFNTRLQLAAEEYAFKVENTEFWGGYPEMVFLSKETKTAIFLYDCTFSMNNTEDLAEFKSWFSWIYDESLALRPCDCNSLSFPSDINPSVEYFLILIRINDSHFDIIAVNQTYLHNRSNSATIAEEVVRYLNKNIFQLISTFFSNIYNSSTVSSVKSYFQNYLLNVEFSTGNNVENFITNPFTVSVPIDQESIPQFTSVRLDTLPIIPDSELTLQSNSQPQADFELQSKKTRCSHNLEAKNICQYVYKYKNRNPNSCSKQAVLRSDVGISLCREHYRRTKEKLQAFTKLSIDVPAEKKTRNITSIQKDPTTHTGNHSPGPAEIHTVTLLPACPTIQGAKNDTLCQFMSMSKADRKGTASFNLSNLPKLNDTGSDNPCINVLRTVSGSATPFNTTISQPVKEQCISDYITKLPSEYDFPYVPNEDQISHALQNAQFHFSHSNMEQKSCTLCGSLFFTRDEVLKTINIAYILESKRFALLQPSQSQQAIFALNPSLSDSFLTYKCPTSGRIIESLRGSVICQEGILSTTECNICIECKISLDKSKPSLPSKALANDNWCGQVPEELKKLTIAEEILVSKYHIKRTVVNLIASQKEGFVDTTLNISQRAIRGHTICFPQNTMDIDNILSTKYELPHSIFHIPAVLQVTFVGSKLISPKDLYSVFSIRPHVVMNAIKWLKKHNILYQDITVRENWIEEECSERVLGVSTLQSNDRRILPPYWIDVLYKAQQNAVNDYPQANMVVTSEIEKMYVNLEAQNEFKLQNNIKEPVLDNTVSDSQTDNIESDAIPLDNSGIIDIEGKSATLSEKFSMQI